ncbi:MAG TPA: DUF6132 family protein [Chitinophagaceae bacterium]
MKNWILKNKLYFIGALLGALAGFLYYKYVGCVTGTCAITSNPFRSSIYFAFFGAVLLGVFKPDKKKSKEVN